MHVFAALLLAGCARPAPPATAPAPDELADVASIEAFARLYGVVRWFHPSDEGAAADWDALAIAGAAAAREARTPDDLRDGLLAVLGPVAPTVQIWRQGEPAPPPLVVAADGPALAWQHVGWSFGEDQAIYRSARMGRPELPTSAEGAIIAINGGPEEALRVAGRRVRVSARLRGDAGGSLFLRIDHGPDDEMGPYAEAAPLDSEWRRHEVATDVADDATWINFGVKLEGRGALWADDFRLEVLDPDGAWRALPVRDATFDDRSRWWVFEGFGYDAAVVEDAGDPVLRLTHQDVRRDALFDGVNALGDAFEGPIGAGLVARVPLALPADAATRPAVASPSDATDADVRVAAALVAWNVLRHFYPYGEDVPIDWEAVLERTIAGAVAAGDREALVGVLWRLLVDVPDGHGWAAHPAVTGPLCAPAFRWLRVGDDLVVTSSGQPDLRVGDVVTAVDGVPTAAALATARGRVSGSEPFRDAFAAERLAVGPCGSASTLDIDRGGDLLRVEVPHDGGEPPLFDHPGIEERDGGILLVDLNAVPWEDLEPELPALAHARGIVFDLREYPASGVTRLLAHLLSKPDEAHAWMRIPQIAKPGEIAGWEAHEWALQPASPHIGGDVVFLTSALDLSAAESILALVKSEGLGTLFGERTAGTNGNTTRAALPGGYGIQFTGMRVVHPDGSRFHLLGVEPDVEASPTLEGLRAGQDEVREAAVAWLRARQGP